MEDKVINNVYIHEQKFGGLDLVAYSVNFLSVNSKGELI